MCSRMTFPQWAPPSSRPGASAREGAVSGQTFTVARIDFVGLLPLRP